jgi:hypothetical protein
MGSRNLDCALSYLLTRPTFRVAVAPGHPFIQLAVYWARHNLAISLLNFATFTISSTMILFCLDTALTLRLARSTSFGALAPSLPRSPDTINGARINIAFSELHQWSITDLAVV